MYICKIPVMHYFLSFPLLPHPLLEFGRTLRPRIFPLGPHPSLRILGRVL